MKLPKFKKSKKQDEKLNKISTSETRSALERERERASLLKEEKKGKSTLTKTKKKVIILAIIVLVGLFALAMINTNIRESVKNGFDVIAKSLRGGDYASLGIDTLAEEDIIGDKAIISSAKITERLTGTGPWDADDEPGNDSSAENNIVRSFDQVTWTTELTFNLKNEAGVDSLSGGTIEVKAELPENCANVMTWDLKSMNWIEDGQVSNDGRTLTGNYTMSSETTTVPGKQTVVFVLSVQGATNGTEIIPTFTFNLAGNEETEKITITDQVIVSAKGKYNIQLHNNTNLSNKTTVNYGNSDIEGRMYGYGFTVQLYNDNESKGLKGIEYPQGEISFDIDLKLERSKFESTDLEDITNEATPIIWNYRVNDWNKENISGNINNRQMYYNESVYTIYDQVLPLGVDQGERDYSTYNSGDINIEQDGNKLHVTINNYAFDGKFPKYEASWNGAVISDREKIYTDNIGTFCVGYMQIFVPDTEASIIEDRDYYLTVSDNNMNINSYSQEKINTQEKTSDDSITIQHIIYKKGTYSQNVYIRDKNEVYGSVESGYGTGDGRANIGDIITIQTRFTIGATNDYDIYTANRFVKFDGDAYEPIYYNGKIKYKSAGQGNPEFKVWYVTKKDGTNWISQDEMNNANIEDMDIYENIEDIPEGKICIGEYFETINGYISRVSSNSNAVNFLLKIKDTAKIGETYGVTQRTWYWIKALDRSIYTITNPDVEWPATEWDSGNRQYIKTEYDENGAMIAGTHSGGTSYGNTVLVVGANLHGNIKTIENSETEKINYDLGKNENVVTYSVEPQLDSNSNLESQIENVTLKAEVKLPKGLKYVYGTSKRGGERYSEPEITENEDGSSSLVWYLYGVTSGEEIDPITFEAQIDNNTSNNTQYSVKFVVSEETADGEVSKIGNSEINFRTSSTTINVINLSSYRLYKETTTPVIDINGDIIYKIIYQNNADTSVPDFQILDILPYNGDGKGTSFDGSYTLKDVKVTQTGETGDISTDNLKLYVTTSTDARDTTAKDETIGVSNIWQEKQIGSEINIAATAIALKGKVGKNTDLEIEITLQTANNTGGDLYYNQATAQINKDTEVITTSNIKSEVVKRQISGMIWYDTNKNGVKDEEESYASNISVKLKKSDGSDALDYNGKQIESVLTDDNGNYIFNNLPSGEYIVEIETDSLYNLTTANVGSNREINSKFEETEEGVKQSYIITKLNGIESPEIFEENVNAGLVVKDAEITSSIRKSGFNSEWITPDKKGAYYNIYYNATIDKYVGDATVTIIDTLPYKIDEEKSSLNGGIYDEETNTITWTEEIKNIDTEKYGPKKITVTKYFDVEFKEFDITQTSFTNEAIGKIELKETGQVDETDPSEYTTNVILGSDLTIRKIDENENGLEGARFIIVNPISGYTEYVMTDENGEATLTVPVGEIIVTETVAPEGYKLNEDPVSITVEYDKENTVTIQDEPIKLFDINLNKRDSETDENIEGIKFNLEYQKQVIEEKPPASDMSLELESEYDNAPYIIKYETITEQYVTSENGMIKIENLQEDVEYTLKEIPAQNGYVDGNKEYKFIVHYVDGEYQIEMLEGEFDNLEIEGNQINIKVENTPSLKIIKQDEEGNLLPGAKFTITDEEGNPVTNGSGETVGTEEEINGQMMTVVTTDDEGRIVENLKPGKYIITEVEAPYGYALPENEEDRVKEIEIDSKNMGSTLELIDSISRKSFDVSWLDFDKIYIYNSIIYTKDGIIKAYGELDENITIPAEYTVSGQEIVLEKESMVDGIIISFNSDGKVIDVKKVSSPEESGNYIIKASLTDKGEIIALGAFWGNIIIPAEETENNQDIIIESNSEDSSFYMICYNKDGKVKWLNSLEYLNIDDINEFDSLIIANNKIVLDYYTKTNQITVPADKTTSGKEIELNVIDQGAIAVFDENEKIETIYDPSLISNNVIYNLDNSISDYYISNGIYTSDKNVIVSVHPNSDEDIIFDSSATVNNEVIKLNNTGDQIIIKCNEDGKVVWARKLNTTNGDGYFNKLKEVNNGYIGIVSYQDQITIPADQTVLDIELTLTNTTDNGQALIKYNTDGQVEWLIDISYKGANKIISRSITVQLNNIEKTEDGYAVIDNYHGIINIYKENPAYQLPASQQVVTMTNRYDGPEINQAKLMSTENNLDYVVPGEKIIYTIIAKNSGGIPKDVLVQDTIPEGTTFVDGSIKVNSLSSFEVNGETVDFTEKTEEDLQNGITLNVPAASSTGEGFVRLSFEVTVNDDSTGEIRNTATVDGKETNEVTKPVVTTEKLSNVIRHDPESTLTDNQVTVNDQIKYTVRVTNTGTTAINNVEVKDSVPEGTKLVSVDNEGVQEDDEITWTIASIGGGETAEVSFTVKVEYAKDNFTITNVATVDDNPTNEVENPYVKPDPELESTLAKNGTDKVSSKDQVVNYEVKFTANVDDFKGKAKVTLVDTLPYEIDISKSKLANGTYNPDDKTITWEEEIDVDTFASDEVKDIVITKSIEVYYLYGDINAITGSMINTANSKIELIETEGEEPVLTDEKEAEKETLIEIPTEVIVHHYIYDAETDTYTTIKLAPDETIKGEISQDYTTSKSSQVPSNYSCVNEQPNNYAGKMTEDTIEVNYYYSLITPTVTNTMDKTASTDMRDTKSVINPVLVPTLTEEGGAVVYHINYEASIDNYKGKATVVIVDTLPAQIDVDKSNLDGGIYNPTYKTITWEETIEDIDTFTNGTYKYETIKLITLVYTGQNMAEDLTNTVIGTVNVYYPEEHSTNPGEVQETETAEDTAVVEQDYKVDLKVEKVWDDNNNEKGHRPDGIIVTIAGGDTQDTVVELNDSNNWSYEVTGLDKYDENGNEINYSVAESEKSPGDLQYYTARLTELSTDDPTVKSYRFTNTYKLTSSDLDANITKTGPEEIKSLNDVVNYEINFTSTVKEYIGDGKVIITDTLPYRIDESKSNLDGGTYDDEARTITWEEDLNNIDTFTNGDYAINISKNISVIFVDLDSSVNSITNTVLGKVRLYETEQEDQDTDSTNTLININGNVIVKYVDLDTGEEISDSITLNGKVGDNYTTSRKQIEGYDYVKSTPNTEGLITEETQEVIYYYQRKDATVIVKYQDTDGNELTEDVILNGKVGDDYTTEQKEFEDYEFVSVTDNAEGTMTEDTITVIYVYQQTPAKVIVKYLEKGTDKQLALDDEITGQVGDEYTTDRKVIKNYQSTEPEPDNKSGTMIKGVITVIYYYERIPAGEVIVKYVDIDTDEEILYKDPETGEDKTYGYTISGFVGDNYETEQKDIPYYNFIRSTSNTTGQLTEAGDTVIYYYQKQKFNLGITKSISEITLDGSSKGVGDGKTTKVEIHRKKIDSANLEVKYKIVVSNSGEISGTAKVVDTLPSGYIVSSNNPTYWTSANGSLETTVELQPGESKELEVVLKWVNGESSFGTGENTARITDIENPANYAETTTQDNEDTATIVTAVETGINRNVYLIITTYLLMIGLVVLLYLYEQYQKERKAEIVPKKTLKLKRPDDKK